MALSIEGHALEAKHLVLITSGYKNMSDDLDIQFNI